MKPECKKEAQWWYQQATSDFTSLDVLLKAGKHDVVCFMAQQVAEKALKAYLISRGEEFIISHSIAKLCDLIAGYDTEAVSLKKKIKGLTPYYVEARYPNALEEIPSEYFEEDDAAEAIRMAKKALEFVKKRME